MKSRVRRLEEDNTKKEKEIEQLLDPGKSEEMRRTLADRKPDAGTVRLNDSANFYIIFCDVGELCVQ